MVLESISRVAERFGVDRRTVADLIRVHGIPTHAMPRFRGKGLDEDGVRRVGHYLGFDHQHLPRRSGSGAFAAPA